MATRPLPRPRGPVQAVYEDFRPVSEWQEDKDSNILLLIHLPGFQAQQLKVSTEGRNIVRVRGERLVAGNKWSRFQEDFPVPDDCILRGTRATFEGGILTITLRRRKKEPQDSSQVAPKITPENVASTTEPTPDQMQIRQPTPQKRAPDQRVPDDQKDIKDQQKIFSELPSRKHQQEEKGPIPALEKRPDHQKVLHDEQKIIKDDKKVVTESQVGKIPDEVKAKPLENTEKAKQLDDRIKIGRRIDLVTGQVVNEESKSHKGKVVSVIAEKSKKKEASEKLAKAAPAAAASASSDIDDGEGNYKHRLRSLLYLNEERQLLVNMGVAILVLVALGVQISHTVGSLGDAS